MSRVFFGGNGPIHWRTTCAQAYAEAIFCGRVLTRAFAGSLLSRNAFANALVFNFLKRELPHLHGHIFRFIGTSSSSWPHIPLHGHIFPFMATYSTSLAHLPLHWHIFLFIGTNPFIGTSSPSWAHLPFKDTWRGGVGGTWFASARAFARLSPGCARDPERKVPNQIHAALAYSKLARRNLKD